MRLVAFDLYGTLLNVSGLAGRLAAILGRDAGTLLTAWRNAQLQRTWDISRTGEYEPFDVVTRRTLLRVSPGLDSVMASRLCAAWLSLPPFPDAGDMLRRLAGAGVSAAVLSNGTEDMIRRALDAAGLPIETVRSADTVRTYKPDERVYALLDELAPREETLFVSGNGWDAQGARAAGHRVCWIDRGGAPPEVAPDLTAGSLAEVAEHVLSPAAES